MARREGTMVRIADRQASRSVAAVLLLGLLPGLAPDLIGSGCPHHAAPTGGGHPVGHAAPPIHSNDAPDAALPHSVHGSRSGAQHADPSQVTEPGGPAGAPDHDVPCRCLGSCPPGGAPPLPGAGPWATAPTPAPLAVEAASVASSSLPPGAAPPFLRPWVRGPPTSKA